MRLGIVGGTGKLGSGLAVRWGRAGHAIAIGSRDPARARAHATELAKRGHGEFQGGDNAWAAGYGEVVVLTVPYHSHEETLRAIQSEVVGKVLIDVTVPLKPPKVSQVHLPPGRAAALEAQNLLGEATPVAAALHHVSAAHLEDPSKRIDCDVLVVSDHSHAKETTLALVSDLGVRGLDGGPLVNAIALESLTPVLIHLNRTYQSPGAGIVFTHLPSPFASPA
jgi:NADPH-dependent F420 reductase